MKYIIKKALNTFVYVMAGYVAYILIVISFLLIQLSCNNDKGTETNEIYRFSSNEADNYQPSDFKSDSIIAFINNSRFNFFWIGVDNPIEIKTSGFVDSISLESDSLTLIHKSSHNNHIYLIRVMDTREVALTVYGFNDGKRRKLCTQKFRTKPLPNGEVYWPYRIVRKDWLMSQTGIQVPLVNHGIDIHFEVTEFTLCTYKNGQMIENKSSSGRFTEEQKEQLRLLNSGDKLYIEDVMAKYPDGSIRNHGTVKYEIK